MKAPVTPRKYAMTLWLYDFEIRTHEISICYKAIVVYTASILGVDKTVKYIQYCCYNLEDIGVAQNCYF